MPAVVRQLLLQISALFTTPILFLGDKGITVLSLINLGVSIILVFLLTRLVKGLLKNRILTRFKIDAGNREAIAAIISYSLGAISFIVIVQTMGFQLASLGIVLGGLGVGIGFGLQGITNDFISGLTLLFERTLKVGDFVELDGLKGYIREVKLRSTVIRTRDNGDVVVPNSQLVSHRVLNWSYDTFTARLKVPVGVAYGSDPVLVTEVLLKSAYMESAILREPRPRVMFRGFGDSALLFELWFWVEQIDKDDLILSSLHFIIEYNLRQAGITIPFPQRDLWLRNTERWPPVAQPAAGLTLGLEDLAAGALDQDRGDHPPEPPPSEPAAIAMSSDSTVAIAYPLRELLHSITYFDAFTELELRQLIEVGYRQRLAPAEILFHEGDPGNAFYVILSGEVEVVAERLGKTLARLQAGQFFGEVSLLLGIPRTAMVRALAPTLLFVIGSTAFSQLLQLHPELAESIVQALGQHQEELAQRQAELRHMGLVDPSEDDRNPVMWARKRLRKLFNLPDDVTQPYRY